MFFQLDSTDAKRGSTTMCCLFLPEERQIKKYGNSQVCPVRSLLKYNQQKTMMLSLLEKGLSVISYGTLESG